VRKILNGSIEPPFGVRWRGSKEEVKSHRRELLDMPAREPPTLDGAKDYRERYEELTGYSLWQCPVCHKGRMLAIEILPRNHSRQTAVTDTS